MSGLDAMGLFFQSSSFHHVPVAVSSVGCGGMYDVYMPLI